eukprot:m.182602 g.182602  ORF g.182602 m.182602 type:complete len:139 (-) comp53485_c0_seq9:1832-2248(-)
MSRRALEHQQRVNSRKAQELAELGLEIPHPPSPNSEPADMYPVHGDRVTMNMNPILYTNIQESEYFRTSCPTLESFEEIVDEIFNQVTHLEPFLPGGANSPSSAFCLLYRVSSLLKNSAHPPHPPPPFFSSLDVSSAP